MYLVPQAKGRGGGEKERKRLGEWRFKRFLHSPYGRTTPFRHFHSVSVIGENGRRFPMGGS